MVDLLICYLIDCGYYYLLQVYELPKSFYVQFIIIYLLSFTLVLNLVFVLSDNLNCILLQEIGI